MKDATTDAMVLKMLHKVRPRHAAKFTKAMLPSAHDWEHHGYCLAVYFSKRRA